MSPNQPRPDNPARAVRISDELWARVLAVAAVNGSSCSAVIRDLLDKHLPREP